MVFNADSDSLWLEMIRKTELHLARSELGSWLVSVNAIGILRQLFLLHCEEG
jgi:hypothetical protein